MIFLGLGTARIWFTQYRFGKSDASEGAAISTCKVIEMADAKLRQLLPNSRRR
jgi:hypothetical protein